MNWRPLDAQPFDPVNYRQATQERRRRLFGQSARVVARQSAVEAEETFQGIQQDDHVKAWEEFQHNLPLGRYSRYVYTRCVELGANYADIIGPTRHRDLIPVRHMLMWEVRNRFNPAPSLSEMAYVFKRDHTSILYAVRKYAARKVDRP